MKRFLLAAVLLLPPPTAQAAPVILEAAGQLSPISGEFTSVKEFPSESLLSTPTASVSAEGDPFLFASASAGHVQTSASVALGEGKPEARAVATNSPVQFIGLESILPFGSIDLDLHFDASAFLDVPASTTDGGGIAVARFAVTARSSDDSKRRASSITFRNADGTPTLISGGD